MVFDAVLRQMHLLTNNETASFPTKPLDRYHFLKDAGAKRDRASEMGEASTMWKMRSTCQLTNGLGQ
jgi:hypothetical protein